MSQPDRTATSTEIVGMQQRSPRHRVDVPAQVTTEDGEDQVLIRDISRSGAALLSNAPVLTNQQFLELHIQGHGRVQGRVARNFEGGYAVQFSSDERSSALITEEELKEFRRLAKAKS